MNRSTLPLILAGFLVVFSPQLMLAEETSEKTATTNKTLVWPDGTRYVGGVRDGKRWGKGTIFWQDGTRFVGNFANDLRNGPGTMILPDGTIYNGYFRDDSLVDEALDPQQTVAQSNKITQKPAVVATLDSNPDPITSATPKVVTQVTDEMKNDIESMLDLWAAAWSEKNVVQYLVYYSDDFDVPGNLSRNQWEVLRRSRLRRPKSINVSLIYEKLELTEPNIVLIEFNQIYQSDIFSDETRKRVKLKKEGEFWRILKETSL